MSILKKIGLSVFGLFIFLSFSGNVYLYVLHKGPKLTQLRIIPLGKDSFVMNAYKKNDRKSIKVWTYRPGNWKDGNRILFVMHGAGRNAEDYLDAWLKAADKNDILLVAPEFENRFKNITINDYAEGNLFTFFGTRNKKD